jgi:hypothetical protein
VSDQRPSLLDNQKGVHRKGTRRFTCGQDYLDDLVFRNENGLPSQWEQDLQFYFRALQRRLERVALLHGDWRACITNSILFSRGGETAILFDPPYNPALCASGEFYGEVGDVAEEVRAWCKAYGDNPRLKIALCGLDGEHAMPSSWERVPWGNQGGAKGRKHEECVWFSPHCYRP